jgi:hypothetical protein
MGTLALNLHKVRLTLGSDNEGFLAYARQHLAALLSLSVEVPNIRVCLYWDQELIAREKAKKPRGFAAAAALLQSSSQRTSVDGCQRLGRRLFLGDNRVIQTEILGLPGLQLQTSLAGANLSVEGAFRPPSKRMDLWLRLGGQTKRERVYAALIYYLVYFPLLWYLERTRRWYPLHASAVAWPQGAVVLAGLGGIGKSTLTLAFLRDPDARLLSENLILHDQERVYAFPEPIHLDDRSRKMLTDLDGRLESTGRMFSHNRHSYEVSASARAPSSVPRLFCFLRQGKELDLNRMSAQKTLRVVMSSDVLAREVNEYAQQAAALNFLSPMTDSFQQRIDALRRILDQTTCYVLTVRPGEDLSQVVCLVREKLER